MKKKIKKEISPQELAEVLEQMAAQLKSGNFEVDGRRWSVPDRLETAIRHRDKKGRFSTRITFRWSSLADYDAETKEAVARWEQSFKALKKRMAGQIKALQKDVDLGRYPAKDTLMDFVRDSLELARTAESEWHDPMTEYLDHLENLQHAIENRQFEVVRHELQDLTSRMHQCHREFK